MQNVLTSNQKRLHKRKCLVAGSAHTGVVNLISPQAVPMATITTASSATKSVSQATLALQALVTGIVNPVSRSKASWAPAQGIAPISVLQVQRMLAGRVANRNHINAFRCKPSADQVRQRTNQPRASSSKHLSATTTASLACLALARFASEHALLAPRPAWVSFACHKDMNVRTNLRQSTQRSKAKSGRTSRTTIRILRSILASFLTMEHQNALPGEVYSQNYYRFTTLDGVLGFWGFGVLGG